MGTLFARRYRKALVCNKEDINTKIVYTCFKDENCTIDGNYLELLELLGIQRDRMICVNAPTRFRKVIIPESAIYPGSYLYCRDIKGIV